jgi:hypothetical protein
VRDEFFRIYEKHEKEICLDFDDLICDFEGYRFTLFALFLSGFKRMK